MKTAKQIAELIDAQGDPLMHEPDVPELALMQDAFMLSESMKTLARALGTIATTAESWPHMWAYAAAFFRTGYLAGKAYAETEQLERTQ